MPTPTQVCVSFLMLATLPCKATEQTTVATTLSNISTMVNASSSGEDKHYLDTAEVVGICLSTNILGIALVVGSLWYNARYPQIMTPRSLRGLTSSHENTTDADDNDMGYVELDESDSQSQRNSSNQYAKSDELSKHTSEKAADLSLHRVVTNPYVVLEESSSTSPPPSSNEFEGFGNGIAEMSSQDLSTPMPLEVNKTRINEVTPVERKSSFWSRRSSAKSDGSSSRGTSRTGSRVSKRGSKKRLDKLDISAPSDFRHEGHIGIEDAAVGVTSISQP